MAARRWAESLALRPLLWLAPFVVLGCVMGRAWAQSVRATSPNDALLFFPALLGPLLWIFIRPAPAQRPRVAWARMGVIGASVLGLMLAHASRRWTPHADDISRLIESRSSRLAPLQPVQDRVVARVLEVRQSEWKRFALLEITSSTWGERWKGRVLAKLPPVKQARRQPQVLAGGWIRARVLLRERRPRSAAWERADDFAPLRGAWCEGEVTRIEAFAPSDAGLGAGEINGALDQARGWIGQRFERGFEELDAPFAHQSARLATAMAFGEGGLREPLPREVREAFRRAGVSHVLVASGAQVALVCALLWLVARAAARR
jgi:predicted membrane metal-binding protein